MREYNSVRRVVWPQIERAFPQVFAYEEAFDREFVGVVEKSISEARQWLHGMDNVYANNLAALKYCDVDGTRVDAQSSPTDDDGNDDLASQVVDERGSYAYRPEGRFGKWQLHYRLFPHEKGTALFVHWELNPLVRPKSHYNGVGWSPKEGKKRAKDHLGDSLHTDASIDNLTVPS